MLIDEKYSRINYVMKNSSGPEGFTKSKFFKQLQTINMSTNHKETTIASSYCSKYK